MRCAAQLARLAVAARRCIVLRPCVASVLPVRPMSGSGIRVVAGEPVTALPRGRLTIAFSRSSGAGGQNVNNLNTTAEVRFNVPTAEWLDDHTKTRLQSLYAGHCTREGDLVVTSQRHRTQEANLEDAVDKLTRMVATAAEVPVERKMRTDVTAATKEGWVGEKRHRSDVKARRRSTGRGMDDD
jgi:protein subunit release factor B